MEDLYNLTPSQIIMYTADACVDCRRAKAFFESQGVSYKQVRIEADEKARNFISQINHGFNSVPTIVFPDGSLLVEPTWEELEAKFRK